MITAQALEDILDVRSRSGDELVCLCVFHDDSNASMWVNTAKGLFTCYSCGAGGKNEKILRKLGVATPAEELHDLTALERLSQQVSRNMKGRNTALLARRCSCHSLTSSAAENSADWTIDEASRPFYNLVLKREITTGSSTGRCPVCSSPLIIAEKTLLRYPSSKTSESYLSSRQITTSSDARACARGPITANLFQLGWNPVTSAITIPYRNINGSLLGVVERRLRGKPKYMYPRKFPRTENLFGAWLYQLVDQGAVKSYLGANQIVLCEGPFDCMKLWQAGLPAVSMWGSMLHEKQISLLLRLGIRSVVIFTDRDSAGRSAASSAAGKLKAAHLDVRLVRYAKSYPASYSDPGSIPEVLLRQRVLKARRVLDTTKMW